MNIPQFDVFIADAHISNAINHCSGHVQEKYGHVGHKIGQIWLILLFFLVF